MRFPTTRRQVGRERKTVMEFHSRLCRAFHFP